jgi:hypothetical protein
MTLNVTKKCKTSNICTTYKSHNLNMKKMIKMQFYFTVVARLSIQDSIIYVVKKWNKVISVFRISTVSCSIEKKMKNMG